MTVDGQTVDQADPAPDRGRGGRDTAVAFLLLGGSTAAHAAFPCSFGRRAGIQFDRAMTWITKVAGMARISSWYPRTTNKTLNRGAGRQTDEGVARSGLATPSRRNACALLDLDNVRRTAADACDGCGDGRHSGSRSATVLLMSGDRTIATAGPTMDGIGLGRIGVGQTTTAVILLTDSSSPRTG